MRTQLRKAETWIAEKTDESAQFRAERDAAAIELAALRSAG